MRVRILKGQPTRIPCFTYIPDRIQQYKNIVVSELYSSKVDTTNSSHLKPSIHFSYQCALCSFSAPTPHLILSAKIISMHIVLVVESHSEKRLLMMRLALQCRIHTHTHSHLHWKKIMQIFSVYIESRPRDSILSTYCRNEISLWCNKMCVSVWGINVIVLYVSAQRRALHLFENFKTAQRYTISSYI